MAIPCPGPTRRADTPITKNPMLIEKSSSRISVNKSSRSEREPRRGRRRRGRRRRGRRRRGRRGLRRAGAGCEPARQAGPQPAPQRQRASASAGQLLTLLVGELADGDRDQVDQDPEAQATEGENLQDARAHLADIETV